MPVTRADATPPLLYPAVLSAEHYVTLTVAINLVRIYTHGRRDERRGTRSCKEVARGGSFVENEARHELALNAGERGKREAAPECRARVDGAVVSIFFLLFSFFFFHCTSLLDRGCRSTGSPAACSFLSTYNVRVRCTGCVSWRRCTRAASRSTSHK